LKEFFKEEVCLLGYEQKDKGKAIPVTGREGP
jgi:hypothetical protein